MKYEIKGNYFNGEFHYPITSGPQAVEHYIKRECPADIETMLWSMPIEYRDIPEVLESASHGFSFWRKLSTEERINFLKRYQEELIAKKDDIAEAISMESGKPLWEAYTEAGALVAKVDVTINDSLPRIKDKHFDEIMPGTQGHIFYKPLGPCAIIGPFNFPCHLANGQILSALISGNSIIFKPSEKTAYSGQILIECFHQAGFPKGVINLVQGDGESARRIIRDKSVKGVFFTGSKEVGLKILNETHQDLSKLVSLELGGKNPAIVHSDANLENALHELLKGSFMTTGQRCTSTSLVVIHDTLVDEFVDRFHKLSKKLIIDHPIIHDEEPFMGPLVDKRAVDSYLLFMGMAKREGLEEIMRGKQLEKKRRGYYVTPSIHLAKGWSDESHFLSSEIFGPNCTIIPYSDFDEAIAISNKTEYGLAAGLFTKDQSLYQTAIRDLDIGLVNLNRSTVGASSKLPFGGVKNSGNYRPAAVSTVDACVYQMASLELHKDDPVSLDTIKGIKN
ncbi:MAG: aldehyde dehydrogenase family protein [Bacteriovoracaceae bacterium]|nr:aldehyde dehydrogenase family protein [Bacteriovoracaceae bacterium]